jgi:hypothetical protein|tara:strand:- start:56 stop:394 length:339 start_codon:yes stop_codon:yes gene_type:complete
MIDIISLISANALLVIIVLIISALPLYLAVNFVGGEAGKVKILLISLVLSFASLGATRFIGLVAGLVMLIGTLVVYKLAFKISLLKAFMVWVLQYVFVFIAVVLVMLVLGVV